MPTKQNVPAHEKQVKKELKSHDGKQTYNGDINDCCEKTPDNYDQDAELMISAAYEIKNLRERNKHMSIRLEMFDKVYSLFTADNGQRNDLCSSGNDIARNLEYRAENRKAQAAAASKPQS